MHAGAGLPVVQTRRAKAVSRPRRAWFFNIRRCRCNASAARGRTHIPRMRASCCPDCTARLMTAVSRRQQLLQQRAATYATARLAPTTAITR